MPYFFFLRQFDFSRHQAEFLTNKWYHFQLSFLVCSYKYQQNFDNSHSFLQLLRSMFAKITFLISPTQMSFSSLSARLILFSINSPETLDFKSHLWTGRVWIWNDLQQACVLGAPSPAGGSIWGSGAQIEAGHKRRASGHWPGLWFLPLCAFCCVQRSLHHNPPPWFQQFCLDFRGMIDGNLLTL